MHPFTNLTLFLWVIISAFTLPLTGQAILMLPLVILMIHESKRNKGVFKIALWLALPPTFSLLLFNGWIIPGRSLFSAADTAGLIRGIEIGTRISLFIFAGLLFVKKTPASRLMAAMGSSGYSSGYSTRTSYLLVSPLLLIVRINNLIRHVRKAQQARGHNPKGSVLTRLTSPLLLIFPVITCALSDIHQRALALDSRGFRCTGQRTVCFPCNDSSFQEVVRYIFLVLIAVQSLARFGSIYFL